MPIEDELVRCWWCTGTPTYMAYHDTEWGWPCVDDRYLFEKICLEGFQAGLSWLTILNKREAFRAGFDNFDMERMSHYTEADVQRLLSDAGIVRHRKKIESAINNAQRAVELAAERGSLAAYIWEFEAPPVGRPASLTPEVVTGLTSSPESVALSKDLKRRGWSFVGPTTMYAFLQAVGLVDDHIEECFRRPEVEAARARLVRPR